MSTVIHTLKRGMSQCYALEEEGLILVDTGMGWKKDALVSEFRRCGLKPRDVNLIIITHGHSDHFGSLNLFLELCGNPPVLCHREASSALETGNSVPVTPRSFAGKLIVQLTKRTMKTDVRKKPEILIDEETDLTGYGVRGRLVPTPGHTLCSLSLLLDTGDALLGDTVMPGRRKAPGRPFFIHDPALLKESWAFLGQQTLQMCFTGHGGPYEGAAVKKMISEALEA